MKKAPRVALNLLLPPGLGVVLLFGAVSLFSFELPDWRLGTAALLYAYLFASLPSLSHALTMEFFYRRGLQPKQPKAVIVSLLSGAVSGLLVIACAAVALSSYTDFAPAIFIYPVLGAATGAATALVIRALTLESA